MRTRRAGVDHTNDPPKSLCSLGIFRRTGLYRTARYKHAFNDATKTPVQRADSRRLTDYGHAVFHFVYREQTGMKAVLIGGKHAAYRLYRVFRGTPVRACARMRACVGVRRNRYNRYKLPLYPPTSLKNQGSRAHGAYRFSKITT